MTESKHLKTPFFSEMFSSPNFRTPQWWGGVSCVQVLLAIYDLKKHLSGSLLFLRNSAGKNIKAVKESEIRNTKQGFTGAIFISLNCFCLFASPQAFSGREDSVCFSFPWKKKMRGHSWQCVITSFKKKTKIGPQIRGIKNTHRELIPGAFTQQCDQLLQPASSGQS